MRPTGLIASNGEHMQNKRLSPLDGLFDQKPNSPAGNMGNMSQYEEMPEADGDIMSTLSKMQGQDDGQQGQQQQQADPYGELNEMLETPDGDMMQNYMEEQRQMQAKNKFLFR